MKGSGNACAGCHTPKHEQMLGGWRETVVKEVKFIKEEARNALESARGRVAGETLSEASALNDKGIKNLHTAHTERLTNLLEIDRSSKGLNSR